MIMVMAATTLVDDHNVNYAHAITHVHAKVKCLNIDVTQKNMEYYIAATYLYVTLLCMNHS